MVLEIPIEDAFTREGLPIVTGVGLAVATSDITSKVKAKKSDYFMALQNEVDYVNPVVLEAIDVFRSDLAFQTRGVFTDAALTLYRLLDMHAQAYSESIERQGGCPVDLPVVASPTFSNFMGTWEEERGQFGNEGHKDVLRALVYSENGSIGTFVQAAPWKEIEEGTIATPESPEFEAELLGVYRLLRAQAEIDYWNRLL